MFHISLFQLLEAETARAIFQDNIQLCNEVMYIVITWLEWHKPIVPQVVDLAVPHFGVTWYDTWDQL